jgi:serine/threonine protein kinase
MGVVYEAQHIDIERKVAMKILRLDLSQHADTARIFRDEARAANRVGSRNIVQIHDFGEMPDGRLYFCMELLSGFDLTVRRDQGIDAGELIGVLRQGV